MEHVQVIGGGLAGCEAAWQLAQLGFDVTLCEMKPHRRTPAQRSDDLAELVCSNSLRSANVLNPVGLLKAEMATLDSLVMLAAHESRVPAGDALAVDRKLFAQSITTRIHGHPHIRLEHREVTTLPRSGATILATGPLTTDALAEDLVTLTGSDRLAFYDALAPIIAGDSIDRTRAFEGSRYGKGNGADYLNCPMTDAEYYAFYQALTTAECMPLHAFEKVPFFEGCLPLEVMAARGVDTLRFGCLKPVGLTDPRSGQRPYAVLQLRKEDRDGQAYNLVGCQTKLKWPEQKRVFAMVPGLKNAEWLRLGAIHRNTYIDSPTLLDDRMCLRALPHVRVAGQITGVEGYVESAAHGLITARLLASDLGGRAFTPPGATTALGALYGHVRGAKKLEGRRYEPQNINASMFDPIVTRMKKKDRKAFRSQRACHDFQKWLRHAC